MALAGKSSEMSRRCRQFCPHLPRQKRNMPQRAASKIERPQELRQAVHLIVMFAVRKGGNLALEGREPGGFLGQVAEGWLRRVC